MLRVKNVGSELRYPSSYYTVLNNFFQNIGDADIVEVEALEDADAFAICATVGASYLNSRIADFDYVTLAEDLDKLKRVQMLSEKPVILIMDTHGPTAPKDYDVDLGVLKKNDIPVGWASLPGGHPNSQEFVGIVSASEYRLIQRWERKPKSLMLMQDSFDFIEDEMHEIIPLFESVFVSNTEALPTTFDGFKNLAHGRLDGRGAIANALLKHAYVLITRSDMGLEMMGVEGGFCGARPIYPDTPFYRDIFQRCEGVGFFDLENAAESIKEIVAQPNNWIEDYHSDFVDNFSAENSIPQFWGNVQNILIP